MQILRDFPGGPVAKTPCSQCRGLGSTPGQGTRSHMLQLRPCADKINKNKSYFLKKCKLSGLPKPSKSETLGRDQQLFNPPGNWQARVWESWPRCRAPKATSASLSPQKRPGHPPHPVSTRMLQNFRCAKGFHSVDHWSRWPWRAFRGRTVTPRSPWELPFCLTLCQARQNTKVSPCRQEVRISIHRNSRHQETQGLASFPAGNKRPSIEGRPLSSPPSPLTGIYQFISVLKGGMTLFSNNDVPLRQGPE